MQCGVVALVAKRKGGIIGPTVTRLSTPGYTFYYCPPQGTHIHYWPPQGIHPTVIVLVGQTAPQGPGTSVAQIPGPTPTYMPHITLCISVTSTLPLDVALALSLPLALARVASHPGHPVLMVIYTCT